MKIKAGLERDYQDYVEKNQDPYGKAVVDFGERWADLMEKHMAGELSLVMKEGEDIETRTSFEANTEGITGFMYGCAVQALAHFWEHGEDLRKWHNSQYGGNSDTQGTINPAIIEVK